MNTIRTRRPLAAAILLAASAAPAQAQEAPTAQALRARTLAATCAACHGTEGRPAPGATLPGLAGTPAPVLIDQLNAFRSGVRPGTVMPQLAKGYSDAQIEQLAAWFSRGAAK